MLLSNQPAVQTRTTVANVIMSLSNARLDRRKHRPPRLKGTLVGGFLNHTQNDLDQTWTSSRKVAELIDSLSPLNNAPEFGTRVPF